jgi:tRNA (guanine10-N2)-dimethyltransferase
VVNLFFLLSGEHPTLPFSEAEAILKAEGHRYKILGKHTQVLRLEANPQSTESIVRRAAMTRACSIELLHTKARSQEILREVRSIPFEKYVSKSGTFVVRIRRIGEAAPDVEVPWLEQELGGVVLEAVEGMKVKLVNPDMTFFGVLTDDVFVFGLKIAEIHAKPFVVRRPRKRPFFHPSAMPAKLARCMVNLVQCKVGDLVLDPFCGTGSFLVEAGLIGCRVVGFDVQLRMVKGSRRNLEYLSVDPAGLLQGDARYPPFRQIDYVVTDPPYGRASTTRGREIKEIVRDLLSTLRGNVLRGKRICLASPKSVNIGGLAEDAGFRLVESHFVYVHRSLTREIAVLERV